MTPTFAPAVPWPALRRSLVAILRGLKPDEAEGVVGGLIEAAFHSIEIAAKLAPGHVLIGAGTVLSADAVDALANAGGRLLVSPNVDVAVLTRAAERGLVTMPGCFTPTEAFQALAAGASALKFFPAVTLGPAGVGAIRAVLPGSAVLGVVGGVSEADFEAFAKVGVRAFGLGSSLYKPGMSAAAVAERGRAAVAAYDRVFHGTAVA